MEIVYEILWEVGKILFFLLVLISLLVSALILFKPAVASSWNSKFNRMFSTDKLADSIDSHIDTTEMVLKHRWWVGTLFLLGALFTVNYLVFDFDGNVFVKAVIAPSGATALAIAGILVESVRWVLVITSLMGVVVCALILVQPGMFKKISDRLDAMFSTRKVQEAINVSYSSLDVWVLKNHVIVGLFLFLGSSFLIVFCITQFI